MTSLVFLALMFAPTPPAPPPVLNIVSGIACDPSVADLERAIYRMGRAWPWQRWGIAKRLAPLVHREAKRRAMDPLDLLAIGSGESDFRPWVKGPLGEIGLWQLTYRDSPVDAAARTLARENPELHRGRPRWLRGKPFSKRELRHALDLSTYIVAREVLSHVRYCLKHDRPGHGGKFARWRLAWWARRWRITVRLAQHFVSVAHYNVGPRPPLWHYLRLLVKRYRWAYYWACTRRKNGPTKRGGMRYTPRLATR